LVGKTFTVKIEWQIGNYKMKEGDALLVIDLIDISEPLVIFRNFRLPQKGQLRTEVSQFTECTQQAQL
jgi:hypothetical protein